MSRARTGLKGRVADHRAGGRRRSDDRGAAAVEFALVLIPLLWIVFGIISYGMMMTFRQTLSQAATEGARAAAVELDSSQRTNEGRAAVDEAMSAVGINCGSDGMTCTVTEAACQNDASVQCVTVTVSHLYRDNPMIPTPPLLGNVMPQTLEYSATVRVS